MRQQQKRSSTVDKAPQPADLLDGEIALNTNAGSPALYMKDADGVIRQLGGVGQVGETSVNGRTGAVTLDKTDVGLDQVDNTSDADKPPSNATMMILSQKADLVGGVVPTSQIPSIAITEYLGEVADEAAMLALVGEPGDWCTRQDTGTVFILVTEGGSVLSHWQELSYPMAGVESVNTQTGAVVLSAADVGAVPVGGNVSEFANDAGYITAAEADVQSVNGQTGTVVLDTDDVAEGTTNKYFSAANASTLSTAVQPSDNVSVLTNDANYIDAAGAPVQSVNTQTGAVVLDTDDVSEGTTNKYVTSAEKTLIGDAVQPGDNISTLNNDAGYLTSATIPGSPVLTVNTQTGDVVLDTDDIAEGTTNKYFKAADATTLSTALQPGDNVSSLTNDANFIDASGAPIQSVNTLTGAVVLDTDDIGEGATNKYVTSAEKTSIGTALQPSDNVSELTNDAGYVTSATAPVTSVNSFVGVVNLGINNLSDVTLGTVSVGDVLSWNGTAWESVSELDAGTY